MWLYRLCVQTTSGAHCLSFPGGLNFFHIFGSSFFSPCLFCYLDFHRVFFVLFVFFPNAATGSCCTVISDPRARSDMADFFFSASIISNYLAQALLPLPTAVGWFFPPHRVLNVKIWFYIIRFLFWTSPSVSFPLLFPFLIFCFSSRRRKRLFLFLAFLWHLISYSWLFHKSVEEERKKGKRGHERRFPSHTYTLVGMYDD